MINHNPCNIENNCPLLNTTNDSPKGTYKFKRDLALIQQNLDTKFYNPTIILESQCNRTHINGPMNIRIFHQNIRGLITKTDEFFTPYHK